jgi:hypothetical protein
VLFGQDVVAGWDQADSHGEPVQASVVEVVAEQGQATPRQGGSLTQIAAKTAIPGSFWHRWLSQAPAR